MVAIMATTQAQTSITVFNEMLSYLNSGSAGNNCGTAFTLVMTNNTIRTDANGRIYQYAAYAEGTVDGRCQCFRWPNLTDMRFSVQTRFSDRNRFNGDADSEDWRIYRSGNQINIDVTLRTWGNAQYTIRDVEVSKTSLGYALRTKSGNGFTTITFIKGGAPTCIG
jgi:hypothetical protein